MAYDDKGTAKEVAQLAKKFPKPKALTMPEDMEDQPPMAQIEEAKRRKSMGEAYDKAVKKAKGGSCYATGGSVKGAGIAQRGVRKCKVM